MCSIASDPSRASRDHPSCLHAERERSVPAIFPSWAALLTPFCSCPILFYVTTEIDRALRMLTQYDAASGGGAGAYGLEDEGGSLDMIDAPMVRLDFSQIS